MRKIIYYCGGMVVDFLIEAVYYEDFICYLRDEKRNNDKELQRARGVLGAYTRRDTSEAPGLSERIAACYVWHYFNTHTVADYRIDGDVMIVDLDGYGVTIEYVAAADVQLRPL